MSFRLYKKEKLRGEIAVGRLFSRTAEGTKSALAYPLRAVYRLNATRHADCPQFLISVPKKRLRHAVDRVKMRRRIREAYRLNRHLIPSDLRVDIVFVYVATELLDYRAAERAVEKLLQKITLTLSEENAENQ